MDILGERCGSKIVEEYEDFMKSNIKDVRKNMDKCLSHLIEVFLKDEDGHKEKDFMNNVTAALRKLFPERNITFKSKLPLSIWKPRIRS